jgi:hypothetical protein
MKITKSREWDFRLLAVQLRPDMTARIKHSSSDWDQVWQEMPLNDFIFIWKLA